MSGTEPCPVCKGRGELTSPGPFGQSIACWVCAPLEPPVPPVRQPRRGRAERREAGR